MPYKLRYTYQETDAQLLYKQTYTGTWNYEFKTLNEAYVALKRLEEHYLWVTGYGFSHPKPRWLKLASGFNSTPAGYFNVKAYGKEVFLATFEYIGNKAKLVSARVYECLPDEEKYQVTF